MEQVKALDAPALLSAGRELVEPALREAVATLPESMSRIVGYHFGWCDPVGRPTRDGGGKALRPALALAAARAVGGDAAMAVPAAVAVELVHNFSLLHDDVMDEDTTRRHRPTAWTVFGTSAAILAGNALLTLAVEVLAPDPAAVKILAAAVQELLDGQSEDLSFEHRAFVSLAECRRMAVAKTGALLGCACALGGHAAYADAGAVQRLTGFGRDLGLAFQFVDDLLGIWGDPQVTGKPAHSDLASRKKSLPVVAALNSGTPAGTDLATFYHRETPMTEPERAHAADLVERAGGRTFAREQADLVFDRALAQIKALADVTDLEILADFAVRRDW